MSLNILRKSLDDSAFCPLCQAAMYWLDAEQFDQDLNFHECSHCQHRVFQEPKQSCHCDSCLSERKKAMRATRLQENRKSQGRRKDVAELELHQLKFVEKLFLLAVLDQHVQEHTNHDEYIHWDQIKFQSISPNFLFQNAIVKYLVKQHILVDPDANTDSERYYLHVRLDGYSEPSLFSITQQLRNWFYQNLSLGIPFKNSEEVKDAIYLLLYQEIIQFTQMYCRSWGIQFAGNHSFQTFCYRLMDSLAVGQIYYLIQTALEYLYKQQILQPRNDNFINTNMLKKTLQQYRERAIRECWETTTLPRPPNLPLSRMSEILFFGFLGYDESIFVQPMWRSWKKIEPRLKFYAEKRCMHCGSNELSVDYDAEDYVTLTCRKCKHQDHYFTQ
jgi:Zn ribbon nucleic-acid-binding protein